MTSPRTWATAKMSWTAHMLCCVLRCSFTVPPRTPYSASRTRRASVPPSDILYTYTSPYFPHTKSSGFSLIEVMVVIALVAVIAGFGMSFSMSSIARSNTQNERDMLVSLLTQARARSIANINEAAHGVYVDTANQRYVIYTKNGGCTNATTTATNIPFLTPATWSGPLDRCFGQLSVRVSGAQTGTTTITLANSSYSISVNSIGRIDW